MIVAPERNHSGASNSLTLFEPLRVTQLGNNRWYCSGTPTDCVHIAITGLLPEDPDMVFSGINHGPNLGDDVLYSGTVAAAMEARVLDVPAVAVSVAGYPPRNFGSAERAVSELFERLRRNRPPGNMLLNVNVPDLPWDEIRGFKLTRMGHRHKGGAGEDLRRSLRRQALLDGPSRPWTGRGSRHRLFCPARRLDIGDSAAFRPHRSQPS